MRYQLLAICVCLCQINILFAQKPLYFKTEKTIKSGAEQIDEYQYFLEENRVAVVANQTSMVGEEHLVDFLLANDVNVVKVFAPEHGFRGKADAGASIKDSRDQKTGLKITSLYGKNKKPSYDHLADVDVVVFDIQDVGVRFYTYISTMHYVMQSCAEMDKKMIVLDRPNPNGFYVDGPVLDLKFQSFIGMHEVPLVHGMTIGEYAQMVNGEGWLGEGLKCDLTVIPCLNYDHYDYYKLPIKPSPNLPNMESIFLYPSLGFFEGTVVSVGRGTDFPFQVVGHPDLKGMEFEFTPEPNEGARYPKLQGKSCKGYDLRQYGNDSAPFEKKINLTWIIETYNQLKNAKTPFFLENNFLNKLAGTDLLMKQIKEGKSESEIRESWQNQLNEFKPIRKKYLLYEDFE
ncbi:MAG: hypothetical protein CL840_22210 [Crocinitomicaceae bacterium]|nr:hypothetical protein [Crocinitomicaceae bacterium]|tara:strand:- start:23149 stop:24354 length:1206 start_codon:yes stop_codon:yes gene_type:complete